MSKMIVLLVVVSLAACLANPAANADEAGDPLGSAMTKVEGMFAVPITLTDKFIKSMMSPKGAAGAGADSAAKTETKN